MQPVSPRDPLEVGEIVRAAATAGRRVRAVGSRTSFSDVFLTEGVSIATDRLAARLSPGPLRRGWEGLVRVGCGCTVQALQRSLAAEGRMLENTPAFTGQTLAGAVSTASHGTGAAFGPICDLVASVDLVLDGGHALRVEPSDGPTDPARFSGELRQEDDLFHSVLVGVGAFGVHVAYGLRTIPLLHLVERRWLAPLDEALAVFRGSEARHVSLLFNPYPDADGVHRACVTERVVGARARGRERMMPRQRLGPLLCSHLPLEGIVAAGCARWPERLVPRLITSALTATCRERYVGPGPVVLDNAPLNQCAAAYACEASLPIDHTEVAVRRVVELARAEARVGRWLTAPVSVRSVGASPHHLAPTFGRDSVVIEVVSLRRSPWGRAVLRPFADALDALGGRPHLGLDVLTLSGRDDVERLFPAFGRWSARLLELDPNGRFDNPFMDRLGLRGA